MYKFLCSFSVPRYAKQQRDSTSLSLLSLNLPLIPIFFALVSLCGTVLRATVPVTSLLNCDDHVETHLEWPDQLAGLLLAER